MIVCVVTVGLRGAPTFKAYSRCFRLGLSTARAHRSRLAFPTGGLCSEKQVVIVRVAFVLPFSGFLCSKKSVIFFEPLFTKRERGEKKDKDAKPPLLGAQSGDGAGVTVPLAHLHRQQA